MKSCNICQYGWTLRVLCFVKSVRQKQILYELSYTWNLKINQSSSQIQRTDQWLPKMREWGKDGRNGCTVLFYLYLKKKFICIYSMQNLLPGHKFLFSFFWDILFFCATSSLGLGTICSFSVRIMRAHVWVNPTMSPVNSFFFFFSPVNSILHLGGVCSPGCDQ